MAMRVQRIDDEYCVVIPRETLEALHLFDGAEVELRPVGEEPGDTGAIRYSAVEEALKSYRATLPQHREAYRELAK